MLSRTPSWRATAKLAEPQFFGLPGPLLGRVGCPGPPSPPPLTATAHAPINARHLRLPLERRDQLAALLTDQGSRHRATRRKNALFAGRESGARTWAILASLINTAKLNDLDPQTYLADVLERMISGRTPVSRLDELLAWHWKAARDALAPAAA